MNWNYRVIEKEFIPIDKNEKVIYYEIHAAYYNDGEEVPHSLSEEPVNPYGDTVEELKAALTLLQEACNKSILKWTDIVKWG